MDPTSYDLSNPAIMALMGAAAALLGGRFIRRLVLLPFEWWSRRTPNVIDDKLVAEARTDLGIPDSTIPESTSTIPETSSSNQVNVTPPTGGM